MNRAILMGRLTRNPEVRYTQGAEPMCISRFTLAVDRKYKREGEPTADFINCTAFGKIGQFVEKYTQQGTKLVVEGHIQTGSYNKQDGTKVYTTDVIVDSAEFAESKSSQNGQQGGQQNYQPQQNRQQGYQQQAQPQNYQPQNGQIAYRSPMEQFQQPQQYQQQTMAQQEGFMDIPPMNDEGLPFGE